MKSTRPTPADVAALPESSLSLMVAAQALCDDMVVFHGTLSHASGLHLLHTFEAILIYLLDAHMADSYLHACVHTASLTPVVHQLN